MMNLILFHLTHYASTLFMKPTTAQMITSMGNIKTQQALQKQLDNQGKVLNGINDRLTVF